MALTTAQHAKALAEAGYAVIPVRENKIPFGEEGLKGATLDPWYAQEWFERTRAPYVGIVTGRSGIVVLDLDYKEDEHGSVVKDGFESLTQEWLEVPESFSYASLSGAGKHIMYAAPEGLNISRKSDYRKMHGVDRQAGESYVVFTADTIPNKADLTPAPEWLLDASEVRSAAVFEGAVQDWYETLEAGEPSLFVRNAMEDARKLYAEKGNDFSHSDIVEFQHRAVRLGAERHAGVPELLAVLEELTLNRTGAHSRNEDEYAHEFAEALASGIQKHGGAIQLSQDIPAYSVTSLPAGVPTNLISGDPGDKQTFSALLRSLLEHSDDDLYVTSVLWNSPRTKDQSREWGLEFVHQRVVEARVIPEPVRENPSIPDRVTAPEVTTVEQPKQKGFLTASERKKVASTHTFIDAYLSASAKKGYFVPEYDIPGAWTALSMAVGTDVVLSYNGLGVNLWFIEMGNTGTGKSQSQKFLKGVLDITLRDGEGYYNLGASSSPSAIHEELLVRDGKSSMVHHDEAASFFSDLHNTEWMKTLEHHFSKFYDGDVEPSNKVRLPAELRGKYARTSFNLNMSATPEKLLSLITTGMFESGFLSRVNWTWAPDRPSTDERFDIRPSEVDVKTRTHPAVYDLVSDLLSVKQSVRPGTIVGASDEAWMRLSQAALRFDEASRSLEMYEVIRGPLTRHTETMVKCAALLALYRGDTDFTLTDALVAISHAEDWYEAMIRVVSETSESDFSRDCLEIERYIRAEGGKVSEVKINHRFRSLIRRSPRELDDRFDHLIRSGRINRFADKDNGSRVMYELNGGV